ncbi:MAG TPA: carbonic anhydrase [Acidobacteriaceae bacterium]|jgi:carbonic anhydrase|nr:carbonic anhydrase [Acidobacteriaceae bacterium]
MIKIRDLNRRNFMKAATASVLGGAVASVGMDAFAPVEAQAQTTDTPQQALQRLVDGNKRYVDQRLTSFTKDMALIRQHTAEKQEPFAAVLSCADSRVPVEIVFDQAIGDVFVTRVAGNIATPEIIASLEYGAAVLGTKVLVVMGHSACGAVKATIAGKEVPGQISSLYPYIYPAVEQAGTSLEAASKQNVKNQVSLLSKASPVLAKLIQEKNLQIVSAFYDVSTGQVTMLE